MTPRSGLSWRSGTRARSRERSPEPRPRTEKLAVQGRRSWVLTRTQTRKSKFGSFRNKSHLSWNRTAVEIGHRPRTSQRDPPW
uniref:Uncharacterized protein MANES_18G061800 n=1 Tax=Rhizophora mucronata TaxID=61149 RepID=A0A2P2P305_RHIMU